MQVRERIEFPVPQLSTSCDLLPAVSEMCEVCSYSSHALLCPSAVRCRTINACDNMSHLWSRDASPIAARGTVGNRITDRSA